MLKKQSSSKLPSRDGQTNYFQSIKPPAIDEMDKTFSLFGLYNDEFKPHYLELPIKIETRSLNSGKFRKNSQSYSQQLGLQNESIKEEQKNQNSLNIDLLETQQKNYDMIDQLLFPFGDQNYASAQQFEGENAVGDKEKSALQIQLSEEQMMESEHSKEEILAEQKIRQRKGLLNAINNFQAYNHSLNIVMNFHTLLKKDTATKMYGSILGVLNRESKKMEIALCEELKELSLAVRHNQIINSKTQVEKIIDEQLNKQHGHKELLSTMPSEQRAVVKEEYFEQNE